MRADEHGVTPDITPVTPDSIARWRLIDSAFECAVDSPRSEWDDIVTREIGADVAMRDEALRLLRAVDSGRFALDRPRLGINDDAEGETRVGCIVANYKLVRLIGRGGMGSVYESVRSDDAYRQRVAVKLMRPDITAPGMARRFRHERQILAALEHRNIARLLDGGQTEHGEPFFVMEYVDGVPITAYCDEQRFSIHDRLRLFLQACAAVQHAHSKLVVHRDLKPANILVTADGSVKLLDFGVARLLCARRCS